MKRLRSDESGFSMVEVMVSILVFALITLGMTPLLMSSLRGSRLARTQTAGKNLVSESMERVRGLPYFDTAANRDLLDLYFPNVGTGYDPATQTFTTTCTSTTSSPAPSAARACPRLPSGATKIPSGYTLTFGATFVLPTNAVPETFAPQTPAAGYSSATAGTATPPASLLRMVITATWPFEGDTKTFSLTSLIGTRKLSPDKVRGNGTIDYAVQVLTSFQDANDPPRSSGLTGLIGRSVSSVEIRSFAAALTEANAGQISLTRSEASTTDPGGTIDSAAGAAATLRAPIDISPAGTVVAAGETVTHSDIFPAQDVAGMTNNAVNQSSPLAEVRVTNGLPKASSNFEFTSGVGEVFWANNQADFNEGAARQLDPLARVFSVVRPIGNPKTLGNTSAETTALSPAASRKVETKAHVEVGRMQLLPTTFGANEGVVRISTFTADLSCRSTGTPGVPTVTGSWSATLRYWRDPPGLLNPGAYVIVPLSGNLTSSAADPLAAIKTENPKVYEGVSSAEDVYLFQTPTQTGYLEDWSSNPVIGSEVNDQTARANMPFAIQLVTATTNPANPASKLTISIGKMSCSATDQR